MTKEESVKDPTETGGGEVGDSEKQEAPRRPSPEDIEQAIDRLIKRVAQFPRESKVAH
jgi:hypothetical protein